MNHKEVHVASQVITAEEAAKLERRPREGRAVSENVLAMRLLEFGQVLVITGCHDPKVDIAKCTVSSSLSGDAGKRGWKVKTRHLATGAVEEGVEGMTAEKHPLPPEATPEPDEDSDE